MTARILDGKKLAAELRTRLAERIATLSFRPGLTVVLVGDDPASAVYVRNKDRAAREVGLAGRRQNASATSPVSAFFAKSTSG